MKNLLPLILLLLLACQTSEKDSNSTVSNAEKDGDKTSISNDAKTPDLTTDPIEEKPTIVKLDEPETSFVIAKSGLRVRSQPSLEGDRIGVRPFGKKVLVTHKTGIELTVQDDGQPVKGEWMGIESRLVSHGKVETVTGYIFSGFLSKEQPENSGVNLTNFLGQRNQYGIGGIVVTEKFMHQNRSPRNHAIAANDSLRIYKKDLKTVSKVASHWFLIYGNIRYFSTKMEKCPYKQQRIYFSNDLGIGNFPYVKEIKDGFAYLGDICDEAIWIKLDELNPDYFSFKSHLDLFKAQPNGGGWEKGYIYIGPNKVLRAEPELNAKAILNNIPSDYEIHLLGPVKDNWAKVKIKQAEHIFGEMYFEKTIYKKSWEGWIMIVEPDGTSLMEPHNFGC